MKKPTNISLKDFENDPISYVASLEQKQAVSLAEYLDYNYHSKNQSLVPDEVYDILKDDIKKRWPNDAYLKKVGHAVARTGRTQTVELPSTMPSMDKLKPHTRQLDAFISGLKTVVVSDKLDGISLQLSYKNGALVACYTRGDGREGQDVSNVIPALKCPKRVSVKEDMLIRCEFIIKKKGFSKFSKSGGGEYVTGRNMGGGLLTHNNPTAQVKAFDVVAYEIMKGPNAGSPIKKQFDTLKQLGFDVVRHKVLTGALSSQRLEETLDEFRKTAEYEIDGIIVDQNVSYRKQGTNNPKHAKAFKVNSFEKSKVVTVKDVVYRRSRLGRLIPRVIIDPTELGGVTVTYFTGHSYFYIQHGYTYNEYKQAQKEGRTLRVLPINVGAKVRAVRSGDVIPYIVSVEKPSRTPAKPAVKYKLGPNNVHAISVEDATDDDEKKRITHFFTAMNIEGLKGGVISKLYDARLDSVGKILFATQEQLLAVDGIQARMASNIIKSIDAGLEKANFSTIGYASGQFDESIGPKRLQAVVDMYPDFASIMGKKSVSALVAMISKVPGIKTQAQQIAEGAKRFAQWLDDTGLELGPEEQQQQASNKLNGMRVLFTGVRDAELLESIISNGGKAASSVKSADALITKPGTSNNKTTFAQSNKIPIYTIEAFRKKFSI